MQQIWRTRLRRLATFAFDRGGLVALLALVAYIWLAPTTIVDGDNAEFSTLGALGGRAHPSGYPAYILYLRLTSWLPGASAAHTAGIATAVLAAAIVLVLHAACRAWGAKPGSASIACALYAASPIVLRMHVEAEVFALNGLVVACVLWLAAGQGPLRGIARGAALGLCAGLGLANHLTCVLVAPIGVLGVARAIREQRAAIPTTLLGLAVGLSTYAYLVIADGPASYGRVDGLGDVLAFVLREDFGGPGAFSPGADPALPGANLAALASTLGRAWLWLPGVLGLAMLGVRIARPAGETRAAWITLAASFVLAGPVLVTRFNIDPVDVGRYIVARFHLLPMLLLAIPVAAAFDLLAARTDRLPRGRGRVAALVAAGFVVLVATSLPKVAAQHSPALEREVANTLRSLPPNAVAVVAGDDLCLGLPYLQEVHGERRDVDVVCWGWLPYAWYQDEMAERGLALRSAAFADDVERILARRPLYFSTELGFALPAQRSHTFGVLRRVLPRGPQPTIAEVFEQNRALFAAFDLQYPRPGRDDDWATFVHRRYAGIWVALARDLANAGHTEASLQALEIARELFPPAFEAP